MNLQTDNKKEKYKLIAKIKMSTSVKELCEGLKPEFFSYMNYVKNLGFYEKPNYSYFRKLFRTLFLRCKYEYDNKYDWIEQDPVKLSIDKRNMFKKFDTYDPSSKLKRVGPDQEESADDEVDDSSQIKAIAEVGESSLI